MTTLKKNMKVKLIDAYERLLLGKRSIIETINDQLKDVFLIEQTRHRSRKNFFVNLFTDIAGYMHQPKKPK